MLWNPGTLRPLLAELVPVAEQIDIKSLKSAAAKVSPEAVALIGARAPWNPLAKTTLIESGSAAIAKWMNALGISAEHSPEVGLSIALVSIVGGRMMLLSELKQLAAEKSQREKSTPPPPLPAAAPAAPSILQQISNPTPATFTPKVNTKEPHA